jgi:protein-L-isoaspartate(D-aspartate) O-methyltransferase
VKLAPCVAAVLALVLAGASCGAEPADPGRGAAAAPARAPDRSAERERMVAQQIEARGVEDPRVLAAMRRVPRHAFVPRSQAAHAYADYPLPIGHDQTISQPFIVAAMAELAELEPGDRVLEVGTGSGYGAAVLGELAAEVYSIEILEPLALRAAATLKRLGYTTIRVRAGDGYAGWPDAAPFDAIVVTAAAPRVPPRLLEQLAEGGHLVIPVGQTLQQLEVHTRTPEGVLRRRVFPVRFVPMTGEIRRRDSD